MTPAQHHRETATQGHAPPTNGRRTRTLWVLLVVLAVLQFGYPVTFYGQVWTGLYMLAYAGMILFGIRVVHQEQVRIAPFVGLAILMAASGLWFTIDQGNPTAQAAMLASVGAFQLALLVSLFLLILSPRYQASPAQLLLAAVAAYLLLGGVFAIAFNLVETASPGSFVDSAAPDRPLVWQGLLYASYVTLATLGYGEVLPISPWARSLTTLATVTGTLFIATVIARLVGTTTQQA